MTVESVTHISDLNASYPALDDPKAEGDDHIRNIKTALLTDLPNITGPITATQAELNVLDNITSTTAELNIVDGGSADSATVLQTTDKIVVNDGGTMVQTALTSLLNWIQSTAMTLANKTLTSPSIATGFTFDSVTFTTVETQAEGISASDTAFPTSNAVVGYVASETANFPAVYAGLADESANNVVSDNATVDAWTMTSPAGSVIVTHNLGAATYNVVATAAFNGADDDVTTTIVKGANAFTVYTRDTVGNTVNCDVEFIVIVY